MKQNPPRVVIGNSTRRMITAHQHVLSMLRPAILDGSIPTGMRLVQTAIADQLEVSTTPVREALRDLASEGLVVIDPHHGAIVKSLTIEEVQEIYQLRIMLEPLMVRQAIKNLTPSRAKQIQKFIIAMDQEPEPAEWVQLNLEFHSVLNDIGSPNKLSDIVANLRDCSARYVSLSVQVYPNLMDEANLDHQELLDLYLSRDEEKSVELTIRHLQSTLTRIENVRQGLRRESEDTHISTSDVRFPVRFSWEEDVNP